MVKRKEMKEPPIRIVASDEVRRGVYANICLIGHRREEFVLDFLFISPTDENSTTLVSRVVVSPAHFKRLSKIMKEQITKYEKVHGKITERNKEVK